MKRPLTSEATCGLHSLRKVASQAAQMHYGPLLPGGIKHLRARLRLERMKCARRQAPGSQPSLTLENVSQ